MTSGTGEEVKAKLGTKKVVLIQISVPSSIWCHKENLDKYDKFNEENKQGALIEVLRMGIGRLDGRDYFMRGCQGGVLRR